jgi:hypothetical protein
MKKSLIFIFLVFIINLLTGCHASKQESMDPKSWKHFRVELTTDDTKEVNILLDSLEITPRPSSVILCVNISDSQMKYLVYGEENEPTSRMYAWYQIPKSVRDFLLNYSGPKKFNLSIVR